MVLMAGFRVVTPKEMREIRQTTKVKRRQVVWVQNKPAFQPPQDVVETFNELLRRLAGSRDAYKKALYGSKFETRYRHKLLNDSAAIRLLKSIAARSKRETVYLVTKRNTPEAQIIVSICKEMIGKNVW